ncbi:hypothetical protein ACHAPA_006744 [Fusarium lateritium]
MTLSKSSNAPIEEAPGDLTISQEDHLDNIEFLRSSTRGRIVVLNGYPGTGKLTILKHFKELLSEATTCLLDNHLLLDPVLAVAPVRNQGHYELRQLVRAPIFEELANLAKQGHTILMSACLAADCQRDKDFYHEYLNIAGISRTPIYWITVGCRDAIHEQRVATPERRQGSKSKLTDKSLLRLIMTTHKLIDPGVISKRDPRINLIFDTMDLSHMSLSFPTFEAVQGQPGTLQLQQDRIYSFKLLRDCYTNLDTLEFYVHKGNAFGLIQEAPGNIKSLHEALSQVNAQLKAITSLKRIMIRFYYDRPASEATKLIQGLGWEVLVGDKVVP